MKAMFERYHKAKMEKYSLLDEVPDKVLAEIEEEFREYKLSILIDKLGRDRAVELAFGRMVTEIWAFDGAGRPFRGFPKSFEGLHPYLDRKGQRPSVPQVILDAVHNRPLLLLGLNGDVGEKGLLTLLELEKDN